MKNVNELRRLVREAFLLNEIPKGGYYQALDLELDPDKAKQNKADEKKDSDKDENLLQNHLLIKSGLNKSVVEKEYEKVMKTIKDNITSQKPEEFNKILTNLNKEISELSAKIKSQLTTGKNISSLYIDNFKELSKKAKELLTKNAKNSLLNNDVKKWYRIESV